MTATTLLLPLIRPAYCITVVVKYICSSPAEIRRVPGCDGEEFVSCDFFHVTPMAFEQRIL